MSRHRRQPSRALPLDFNVDGDDGPAGTKGATSLDGSQNQNPGAGSGGGRRDAGKGQEGNSNKPPPATGSRSSAEGGAGNKSRDDASGGP
ncbi:hypothetical protein SETIT_5G456200v2 [Setaria italica]|uniref:Uncharacterized protein n=2 Tax=Setaria TaxID=4554 RepID=K3XNQ8_SETIT|nr:hypothetical protein SETIT_5G456200v2 [Setaria italica]TKW18904.1 hypothetical protein SEVIR_5G462900v2 [Setaria viridis]